MEILRYKTTRKSPLLKNRYKYLCDCKLQGFGKKVNFLVDGYFGQKVLQPGNRYFWKIAVSNSITVRYRGFEKKPISWLFFFYLAVQCCTSEMVS